MGRQFLLELIPYRGAGRLYLFSLSTAALLFFSHQINKAIQHSRVAVQDITTTDGFGIIVGNGLGPFLIASGVTPIPVPVSYTHLDVYKRQLQLQQRLHCLVISLHSKATHQVGGRAGIFCGDVYKRQAPFFVLGSHAQLDLIVAVN